MSLELLHVIIPNFHAGTFRRPIQKTKEIYLKSD